MLCVCACGVFFCVVYVSLLRLWFIVSCCVVCVVVFVYECVCCLMRVRFAFDAMCAVVWCVPVCCRCL